MFKKTMTYTDWNGVERTEDAYFNLSKAELVEMQLTTEGGFNNFIDRIVKAKDTVTLIKLYKELILKAYGRKSDDGRRFEKSDEISREFSETPMYSDLYIELVSDEEAGAAFIKGIMPANLAEQLDSLSNKTFSPALVDGGK